MAARKTSVDPISTTALFVYGLVTAVMLGLITVTVQFANVPIDQYAPFVALASAGVAVLYNGADLRELSRVEMAIIGIGVIGVAGRQFVPAIDNFMTSTSPWGALAAWVLGAVAVLILAYGEGVDWYPLAS